MSCYSVWYLGGYLKPGDERERYNDFGKTLAEVFHTLARVNDHFKRHYTFNWIERCTKETFLEKWQSSTTAGIIFHSHSDFFEERPAPLAYHHILEDQSKKNFEGVLGPTEKDGMSALRLDPKKLPVSSRSLRVLALLACDSAKSNDDWKAKTPGGTCVVVVAGALQGGDDWGPRAKGINAWIWANSVEKVDFRMAKNSWEAYQKWADSMRATFRTDPMKSDGDRSAWEFFKYLAYKGPAGNYFGARDKSQDEGCWNTPPSRVGGRLALAAEPMRGPVSATRKPGPLGVA